MPDSVEPLILKTKLNPPRLDEGRVVRDQLLGAFTEHGDTCLTLVSAPAGYGKSTLVAEWTAADSRPAAWVCLDESDNDLPGFLRYVVAAVESIYPESCPQTALAIEAPDLPSVRFLAGQFSNELDAIGEPLILVLDDYHHIRDRATNDFLSELLRHPPSTVHWVIATRRDPPLPLASLRASRRMSEIRFEDLQFSQGEIALLAEQIFGQRLSETALERVGAMTEGWVAGLQLIGLASRKQADPEAFVLGLVGNVREVQDYLISEVLSQETPEFRRCILRTSLVDRFSASFCKGVCDQYDDCPLAGEGMMEKLAGTGVFMTSLDEQGEWYRYHHLFRDLLRRQLEKEASDEEVATRHLRASRWLEDLGSIDESIALALKGGDLNAAATIVESHRHHEFGKDRWWVVDRWLRQFPGEFVWSHPDLLVCKGMIANCRFQLEKIPTIIDHAEALLVEGVENPELRAEMGFLRGTLAYWSGEGENARLQFEPALSFAKNLPHIASEAELMLGLARSMCGGKTAAVSALEERLREIDSTEIYLRSRLVAGLAMIHLVTGNLPRARADAHQLRHLAVDNKIRNTEAWGSYLLACAHLHAGEMDAAVDSFSEVLGERYVLETRAFFDASAGLALAQQFSGNGDAATKMVDDLEKFALDLNGRQYLQLVYSCRARIALLRGDSKQAADSASLISETPSPAGLFMWLVVPPITRARVLVASGSPADLAQAAGSLDRIGSLAESCRFDCQVIEVKVIEAMLLEKQERLGEAVAAIESALELAEPGGFIRPFIEAGSAVLPILAALSEGREQTGFITGIVASLSQPAVQAVTENMLQQPLFEPLTNRELDVLELVAERLYDKEIGDRLSIAPGTVKSHLKHLYQKLDVGNRRQAVEKARALKILPEDS